MRAISSPVHRPLTSRAHVRDTGTNSSRGTEHERPGDCYRACRHGSGAQQTDTLNQHPPRGGSSSTTTRTPTTQQRLPPSSAEPTSSPSARSSSRQRHRRRFGRPPMRGRPDADETTAASTGVGRLGRRVATRWGGFGHWPRLWLPADRSWSASSPEIGEGDRPSGDHAADHVGIDQTWIGCHDVGSQRCADAEPHGQPGEPAATVALAAPDDHRGGPGYDQTVDGDR
jgi:hypothetical protein